MLDLRLDDDRGKSKAGGTGEPRRPSASASTKASNSSPRVLPARGAPTERKRTCRSGQRQATGRSLRLGTLDPAHGFDAVSTPVHFLACGAGVARFGIGGSRRALG